MEKNIPVKKAALLMGKSEQFVRVSLQQKLVPFGYAVKRRSSYSYYINPVQFYTYMGMPIPREVFDAYKEVN